MFEKFIRFIKYNNAAVIIFALFFIVGSGVLASETGREALGQKNTRVEGVDNTALLEADLEGLDMDFKIEDIAEDEKFYYVTYTYLDLLKEDSVWQWMIKEKIRKVSKKSGVQLDRYLLEEFREEYQSRLKELSEKQAEAESEGEQKKKEVTEYSGLVGRTLALAENVFAGYEAVQVRELPTPINSVKLRELADAGSANSADSADGSSQESSNPEDSISRVYDDYMNENDPDRDDILDKSDNCPDDYNPEQGDRDDDGIGDVCDSYPDDAENNISDDTSTSSDDVIVEDNSEEAEKTATGSEEVVDDNTGQTASGTDDTVPETSGEEDTNTESGTADTANDSIDASTDASIDASKDAEANPSDSSDAGTENTATQSDKTTEENTDTPTRDNSEPDTTSSNTDKSSEKPDVEIVELGAE